jgi:hypothetical protein
MDPGLEVLQTPQVKKFADFEQVVCSRAATRQKSSVRLQQPLTSFFMAMQNSLLSSPPELSVSMA